MGKIRPRQLTEFLEILWRRKGTIFLIAAGMLFATIFIVERLPNIYEARGLVVVAAKNGDDLQLVMTQITAATQQLTSQTNLDGVLQKYNVYPNLNRDSAIAKLRKAVKTETKFRGFYPDGPESFTVSYRHTEPKLAEQVMTELVSVFDSSNVSARQQTNQELQSVHNELTEVEQQLQAVTNDNTAKNNANRPTKTKVDQTAVNTQRFTTTAAIASLSDKQFGLEQQIAHLKKQIDEQQKLVKQTAPPANPRNAQGPLLVRKAELEAQLKDYATQYTEKNPKVVQARTQLAEVNRQLTTLNTNNDVDPSAVVSLEAQELRTQQRELARLETEREITQRELERKKQFLATIPVLDPSTAFTREEQPEQTAVKDFSGSVYANLSERHKTLLTRQERLQKALVVGPGIFQVLDQSTVSQTPVAPNRLLLKLIGLTLALATGIMVALVLEFPRVLRLQDERDVEYFLGAPVLALIPETLTPAEGNRVQRLHFARGVLMVLGAGLLVPIFYFVLNSTNIFQLLGNR